MYYTKNQQNKKNTQKLTTLKQKNIYTTVILLTYIHKKNKLKFISNNKLTVYFLSNYKIIFIHKFLKRIIY